MTIYAEASIVVGINLGSDFDGDKAWEIAEKMGLTVGYDMSGYDEITSAYIGVEFDRRPTDAEVEEATDLITPNIPMLEEKLGTLESGVEEWMIIGFDN